MTAMRGHCDMGEIMATNVIPQRPSLSAERRFFATMALIVLLTTFIGFAPSYYLRGLVPAPHPYEVLRPYVFSTVSCSAAG